jgi:hypothetical protein
MVPPLFGLAIAKSVVHSALVKANADQTIHPLLSHDIVLQVIVWVVNASLLEGIGSGRYQAT